MTPVNPLGVSMMTPINPLGINKMTPVEALDIFVTAISLYLIKPVDIANCTASVTLCLTHTVPITIAVTAAAVKSTIVSPFMRTAASFTQLDIAIMTTSITAHACATRAHRQEDRGESRQPVIHGYDVAEE